MFKFASSRWDFSHHVSTQYLLFTSYSSNIMQGYDSCPWCSMNKPHRHFLIFTYMETHKNQIKLHLIFWINIKVIILISKCIPPNSKDHKYCLQCAGEECHFCFITVRRAWISQNWNLKKEKKQSKRLHRTSQRVEGRKPQRKLKPRW